MSCFRRGHGASRLSGIRRRRAGRGAAGVCGAQMGALAAVTAAGRCARARRAAARVRRARRRDRKVQVLPDTLTSRLVSDLYTLPYHFCDGYLCIFISHHVQ